MIRKSSRPTSASPFRLAATGVIAVAAIAGLVTFFNPAEREPEFAPVKPLPEAEAVVDAAKELEWRIARATIEEGGASSPVLIVQALLGLADVAEGPLLQELSAALKIPDGRTDIARAASAELRKGAEPGRTALMTIWPIVSEEQAAREMAHYTNFELIMLKNPGVESVKTVCRFLNLPKEVIKLDKDTPHFVATQGLFDSSIGAGMTAIRMAIPQTDQEWTRVMANSGRATSGDGLRVLRGSVNRILDRARLPAAAYGAVDLRYLSSELRARPLGAWLQWLRVQGPEPRPGEAVILTREGRPFFVEASPVRLPPAPE